VGSTITPQHFEDVEEKRMSRNPLEHWLGPPVRLASLLVGYSVLAISLMVGLEIVLRRGFGFSLQGVDEYGGYMLAAVTAIGAAYTLLERGHTRIEIITERLPLFTRALLNLASALLLSGIAILLAWLAVLAVGESMEYRSLSGTPLMTPLWMPQSVWAGGMVLFALVASGVALHGLYLLIADWRLINRWYGIKTVSEEIDEVSAGINTHSGSLEETRDKERGQ
jgi:TRAP-type C4-dicarboxylate transport system permease small subunit